MIKRAGSRLTLAPAHPESDVEVSEMSDSSKPEGAMPYGAALRLDKQLKLDAVKEKAGVKAPKAWARKPHPEASHPQPEATMLGSSKAKSKKRARNYEEGSSGTDEGDDGGYDPRNSKKQVRRISKSGSVAGKRSLSPNNYARKVSLIMETEGRRRKNHHKIYLR